MFTYDFRPPPINIYVPPFPNANYEMQDLIVQIAKLQEDERFEKRVQIFVP